MIFTQASAAEISVALPKLKLLIANRWVASKSGKTFATINPSTGDEICQVAEADTADVEQAVQCGASGLRAWAVAQDARVRARPASESPCRSD